MTGSQKYITLIHKQLTGAITRQESAQLHAWLNEAAENQGLYDDIAHTWELSERYPVDLSFSTDHELTRLLNRIDRINTQEHIESKPAQRKILPHRLSLFLHFPVVRYAASIGFLIALLYTGYYLRNSDDQSHIVRHLSTNDQIEQFLLSDSSVVDLNRHTTLHFQQNDQQRIVQFSGEGFFHVKPNRDKPFIIHTSLATIEVVGTSFNVRALENENKVVVSVASGIVKVIKGGISDVVTVGQQCIVYKTNTTLEKAENTDRNYLSWKTGKIQFEDVSLKDVFLQLEQTYQTKITVKEPHLLTCRFTGSFEHLPLTHVFEILEFNFGMHVAWEEPQHTVTITGGTCK